jgi:hypothetical protein
LKHLEPVRGRRRRRGEAPTVRDLDEDLAIIARVAPLLTPEKEQQLVKRARLRPTRGSPTARVIVTGSRRSETPDPTGEVAARLADADGRRGPRDPQDRHLRQVLDDLATIRRYASIAEESGWGLMLQGLTRITGPFNPETGKWPRAPWPAAEVDQFLASLTQFGYMDRPRRVRTGTAGLRIDLYAVLTHPIPHLECLHL